MSRRGKTEASAVRIICVLALLFLGLSHKMPVVAAWPGPVLQAEAYALPDGSAPDLCLPQPAGKLRISYPDCDACRLAASVILPVPPGFEPPRRPLVREPVLIHQDFRVAGRVEVAALPRGPPVRLFS